MKLVVLESPFANSDLTEHNRNIDYARTVLRDSIMRGEAPVAFHLLYTQDHVLRDSDPMERTLGIAISTFWWETADLHVFYTDRGWSRGMVQAWEWVSKHKVPFDWRSLEGRIKEPPPLDLQKLKIEEPSNDKTQN